MPDKRLDDEDMVSKKEHAIDKRERKKDVEAVLRNGRSDNTYPDKQRLTKMERTAEELGELIDNLQAEGLVLARRVKSLARQLYDEEHKFEKFKNENQKFIEKCEKAEEDEKNLDVRREHTHDTRRELYLRIIGYIIPIAALIVVILIAMKVIK